jgi:iron-sulfur cluster repair protein YtfE (RIC family)
MASVRAFREEHAELLEHVERLRTTAAALPRLSGKERAGHRQEALEFLRRTLIPHAEAEEEVLYPAVAEILGDPRATATMISDHRAIVARIDALADADLDDVDRIQELLYGLHALLLVHFHKEEEDYLPLFEDRPDEEVAAIFERMRHGHGH